MAVKAFFSHAVKRGRDLFRLPVPKPKQPVENFQSGSELLSLRPSQAVAPIRTLLFTSRVSYQTLASQLRRRAALEFGRTRNLPIFAFVGLALATSSQDDRDENEALSSDIREILQSRIGTSPILQKLSLQSFDFGKIIGKGCNAVVYEARLERTGDQSVMVDSDNENSSDFIELTSCPIRSDELEEAIEEEDKWFPPPSSDDEHDSKGERTQFTSIPLYENCEDDEIESFAVIEESEGETSQTFSLMDFDLRETIQCNTDRFSVECMSLCSTVSDDKVSLQETEPPDNSDKWSFVDEPPDNEDRSKKYDLAIKMMFNYEVESKADSVMKAMEKETVPARVPIYQINDSWYIWNRVKLKSLPQHANIVDMYGAFVDSFDVPQISDAMETYPAALPKRLYSNGLGRNMTMYIVMRKYDMTLRQYLQQYNPDIHTRCLLLTQLLEGIVHLGNHGIAHRDIKSDNLFLELSAYGSVPRLVIGDFGCCLADSEFGQTLPYFTSDVDRGGNCSLMAPEISTASPGRDVWLDFSKSDLWAVGTIIYELFSMENPFYGNQSGQVMLDSRTYKESDLPTFPDEVPGVVRMLARMCLSRDPSQRPSPVDAANLMQIYLWFPDWLCVKPRISEMKEFLLILTAQVILQRQPLDKLGSEVQLRWTFLHRININDLKKIFI